MRLDLREEEHVQGVPAGAALQVVKAACPAGGPGGWPSAGGTEGGISEVCEPRCPETRVGGWLRAGTSLSLEKSCAWGVTARRDPATP